MLRSFCLLSDCYLSLFRPLPILVLLGCYLLAPGNSLLNLGFPAEDLDCYDYRAKCCAQAVVAYVVLWHAICKLMGMNDVHKLMPYNSSFIRYCGTSN